MVSHNNSDYKYDMKQMHGCNSGKCGTVTERHSIPTVPPNMEMKLEKCK